MHRRSFGLIAAIGCTILVSGCVQATRHSNTMIFGTNTSVGLKVGTAPSQVPSIVVGYDRQEAVIMPLLANTRDLEANATAANRANLLSPCPIPAESLDGQLHPCVFAARRGDAVDAYSVLASFGADFEASSSGTQGKAKGGLAQYFSTGMAAQILALTGGASVVAVGEAAAESAESAPETARAVPSLFGQPYVEPTAEEKIRITQILDDYSKLRRIVGGRIAGMTDADAKNRVAAFETKFNLGSELSDSCASQQGCADYFDDQDALWKARFARADDRLQMIADAQAM